MVIGREKSVRMEECAGGKERMVKTYPECSPTVNAAIFGDGKRGAVAGGNLDELGVGRNTTHVDLGGLTLAGVETRVVGVIGLVSGSHTHLLVPEGGATKSSLIVDAPGEDLVVIGESDTVHSTTVHLDDADARGRQQHVLSGALDIDGRLSVDSAGAEAQLSGAALTENENVERGGRGEVDLDENLDLGDGVDNRLGSGDLSGGCLLDSGALLGSGNLDWALLGLL